MIFRLCNAGPDKSVLRLPIDAAAVIDREVHLGAERWLKQSTARAGGAAQTGCPASGDR